MSHKILVVPIILFILFSCSKIASPEKSDPMDASFSSFSLDTSDNMTILSDNIEGRIEGDAVFLDYTGSFNLSSLTPRFETKAVSVEVNGVKQISGKSSQDFSLPVSYVLTAASGAVTRVNVTLERYKTWQALGAGTVNEISGSGITYRNIRVFDLDGQINVIYLRSDNKLLWRYYIPGTGSWNNCASVAAGSNVTSFDIVPVDGDNLVVLKRKNDGEICIEGWQRQYYQYSIVSHPLLSSGSFVQDLQLISGSAGQYFAAWINDSGRPVVWFWNGSTGKELENNATLNIFNTESFRIVSPEDNKLYGAAISSDSPGVLHFFSYDFTKGVWCSCPDGEKSLFRREGQELLDMVYDEQEGFPVIFLSSPLDQPGLYAINTLYWNATAGVWTNLSPSGDGSFYVAPLILSGNNALLLSCSWHDNLPAISAGRHLYTWNGSKWHNYYPAVTADPISQPFLFRSDKGECHFTYTSEDHTNIYMRAHQ